MSQLAVESPRLLLEKLDTISSALNTQNVQQGEVFYIKTSFNPNSFPLNRLPQDANLQKEILAGTFGFDENKSTYQDERTGERRKLDFSLRSRAAMVALEVVGLDDVRVVDGKINVVKKIKNLSRNTLEMQAKEEVKLFRTMLVPEESLSGIDLVKAVLRANPNIMMFRALNGNVYPISYIAEMLRQNGDQNARFFTPGSADFLIGVRILTDGTYGVDKKLQDVVSVTNIPKPGETVDWVRHIDKDQEKWVARRKTVGGVGRIPKRVGFVLERGPHGSSTFLNPNASVTQERGQHWFLEFPEPAGTIPPFVDASVYLVREIA